jgi:alpha-D-ribose 1-methylphosphonate 5-triphosphate diphosphatase
MSEKIFKNARIVLADEVISGSVKLRDGMIEAIDEGNSQLPSAEDFEGDLLIPGLIELHTDNLERHVMPRPGTLWPVDSAVMNHDREMVGAGITTVFDALAIGEVHKKSMRVKLLREMCDTIEAEKQANALKADHFLHLRCEVSHGGMMDLLEPLIDHDIVRLMSVMDHTPGQRQFVKMEKYAEYYQGKYGFSDEQLEIFIKERRADQEQYSTDNRQKVVDLAHERNIALASHDDATKEHVEEAVSEGLTIAEFPTTLEAAKASHEAGLAVLMGGPNIVRGHSHSGNISARDLADKGVLDIISSDYVPASLLFGAMVLEKNIEEISLPDVIACVTRNPAKAAGFDDRGEILVGKRGDIVRVKETSNAPIVYNVWREGEKIA